MANPFRMPMVGRSLRNLVSRPATRRYPAEPARRVPGARGKVEVDLETCVFCGLCARKCPAVAIEVSKERRSFALEHLRCVGCALCVDACNKDSLRMAPEPVPVHTGAEAGPEGSAPLGREVRVRPAAPAPAPAPAPET